jgi:C-terminal processing protease CtpA/Prc
VLTDGGSASAAEDIPFVLQNLGRAKIVGERTAGAGRNNRFIPAGDGLLVSVSVTRVTDPRSGREWERVGIQPDLAVASEQALAAAHRDALSVILQHTRDSRRRRDLQRALQDLQGSQAGRL